MSEPSNDERPKGARATRTWLARVVLLAMVLGAIAFFNSRQVEAFVALGVGPVMRADDGNGLTREKIELNETVYFDTSSAIIQTRSYPLLDEVVSTLLAHPEIQVRVEGHTCWLGPAEINRALSQARAESVRAYLINKQVDAERLEAIGFGEDRPIADNKTKEGREENRRVEFIVKQDEEKTP